MSGFSFGVSPAATSANTSLGFGNTPTLSFGTGGTATTPGGLTFGAPNTSTASFGSLAAASTGPQPGGITFGSNTATPAATTANISFGTGTSGGGLNFKGATTTAPGSGTSFTFGATGQQQQPTFAAPTTSATTSATGGLSFFNAPTCTPQATLSFGATPSGGSGLFATPQTTSQPSLTFAAPTSTAIGSVKPSLTTLSFGVPGATTTTTAATPGSLGGISFGVPSAAKTTSVTGFSLSTPSTGTTGIFGFPATTSSTSVASTTTAAPVFKGLGGVDTTQSLTGAGGRPENKTAKENLVPNDVLVSIENFKSFVKSQKNLSCEVARASVKPMAKVTEDTQALQQLLSSLAADVQKNNLLAERLKAETSKGFAQCEMAQRTHDTPAGLQNDNTAPLEFFMNLAAKFEHNVHALRQEIDNTEKYVNILNQPSALTPQELSLALKRLHESFVALAGRLQVVHQTVVAQKERHLSLRRHFLKDATDIFSKPGCDANKKSGIAAGPTPFSAMGTVQTLGIMVNQDKTISSFAGGGSSITGWSSPQTTSQVPSIGGSGNLFGSSNVFSSTTDNSNFQLLKPPPGNKRGKR